MGGVGGVGEVMGVTTEGSWEERLMFLSIEVKSRVYCKEIQNPVVLY